MRVDSNIQPQEGRYTLTFLLSTLTLLFKGYQKEALGETNGWKSISVPILDLICHSIPTRPGFNVLSNVGISVDVVVLLLDVDGQRYW